MFVRLIDKFNRFNYEKIFLDVAFASLMGVWRKE